VSVLLNIIAELKPSLEAQTDLTGFDVFGREPIKQDDPKGIYIYQESCSPGNVDLISTNQFIRLNVKVKFFLEGRTRNDSNTDSIVEAKAKYAEAVKSAARLCRQGQTYEIAGIYHVAFVSEDLNPEAKNDEGELAENEHKILLQFDFFTFGE